MADFLEAARHKQDSELVCIFVTADRVGRVGYWLVHLPREQSLSPMSGALQRVSM